MVGFISAANPARATALALLLAAALGACSQAVRPAELAPAAAPTRFARTVDLTHVIREDVPINADEPPTRLYRDADGRLATLTIGARTGSLARVVNAPGLADESLETLSPRDLVLPAVVIDARDRAQDDPAFALTAADVLAWEQAHGPVPQGAMVLMATGWDVRWGDPQAYLNPGPDGRPRTPGFAPEAAALLVGERGAAGLGLDAPLITHTPAGGFTLLLENLTSVEQLPATGALVVVGALKLQAATSGPARVLALVP